MPSYLLTVETDEKAEHVFIHGNPAGLRYLATRLEAIALSAEKHGQSHDHFMSEEWGGAELSGVIQGAKESSALINHLIVYCWEKNEAPNK